MTVQPQPALPVDGLIPTLRDDRPLLEAVFAASYRVHLRTALLVIGSLQEAEDAVQDAFVSLYARPRILRDRAQADAYVRKTILNAARDRRRSRRRRNAFEFTVATLPEANSPYISSAAAEDALLISRLLKDLPRRQREVLILRYLYDQTEQQVAHELGVSQGTVKTHASRALARLNLKGTADE